VSSQDDLTARARIRDAALELFAERGIAGATIRDIALKAGVSSGLLRHHFGSKEGLRDACDEFAMARLNELRQQMLAGGKLADESFLGSVHPVAMQLQAYLVRSMIDGSTPQLFQLMVQAGEHWIQGAGITSRDPKAFAGVLVAMQMGMFLLRDQLSQTLGVDAGTPVGHSRVLKAAVEIFAQPLVTPEQAAQALAALDLMTDEGTGKDTP
jgi:TetR/AcrR family transcriptional regulator, regulator of cefoperazone and chloramphenicol sensitivity